MAASKPIWRKARRSNEHGGDCVEIAVVPARWRKARRSNDQGGACVELAGLSGVVAVRDSKDPEGARLLMSREAFREFAAALKE